MCLMVNYFDVRQKIALALKKSGLRVKSPFKVPLGWVDVAVFKKGYIGIDICIENIESSFKRLLSYPFKNGVVLNLTDKNVDASYDNFIVVNSLKELENLFEKNFKLNVSFDVEIQKDHVEFSKQFNNEMELRSILDSLIFLYICKEVLEEESDKYYFKALKTTVPKLKEFNLVVSSSKGIKPKFHHSFLSLHGLSIAKSALIDRLLQKEEFLKSLAKEFGSKIYIIFTAIQRDSCLIYEHQNFGEKSDLQSLLLQMRNVDLYSLINRIVSYKHSQNSLSIFCYIITYIALYNQAVEILRRLEHSGLASKVPVYSPYGIKLNEIYKVPAEVIDFILKISNADIDEDLVNETVVLSLLLKTRLEEIEMLQNFGIPIDKIRQIKELLKEKDLVDKGNLKDSYENFLKIKLAMICEKILRLS